MKISNFKPVNSKTCGFVEKYFATIDVTSRKWFFIKETVSEQIERVLCSKWAFSKTSKFVPCEIDTLERIYYEKKQLSKRLDKFTKDYKK